MVRDTLKNSYLTVNLFLTFLYVAGNVFVLFFAPVFFSGSDALLLLALTGLLSNPHWVLIHEAIHGVLFKKKTSNDIAGRVLSIVFGSPFRVLQGGHLLHHGYNRTKEEITDYYNPREIPKWQAVAKYYFWILGGLYIAELLSNFLLLLPKALIEKLRSRYKETSPIRYNFFSFLVLRWEEAKIDAFLILLLFGVSFFLYGENWYALAVFLLLRGFVISIMDNVFHYGTEPNRVLFGYNLKTNRILEVYLLHANYHGFHHLKPKIPWYEIKDEWKRAGGEFHGNLFPQLVRQLRGPIPSTEL